MEFDALITKDTWTLVPPPTKTKIIRNRWIFHVKKLPNGMLDKRKSMIMAKGYDQSPWFDFLETFSLVVKQVTIRVIVTIALSKGWKK